MKERKKLKIDPRAGDDIMCRAMSAVAVTIAAVAVAATADHGLIPCVPPGTVAAGARAHGLIRCDNTAQEPQATGGAGLLMPSSPDQAGGSAAPGPPGVLGSAPGAAAAREADKAAQLSALRAEAGRRAAAGDSTRAASLRAAADAYEPKSMSLLCFVWMSGTEHDALRLPLSDAQLSKCDARFYFTDSAAPAS